MGENKNKRICVGVLALQGAFFEHCRAIEHLGCIAREIRKSSNLDDLDGLIIPGGESTTMGKLLQQNNLFSSLQERIAAGWPVFGTCAGLILLAQDILGSTQPRLGSLAIQVRRNGYGRQVDSFEANIPGPLFSEGPFPAVFIRAPLIEQVNPEVQVLAEFQDHPVWVRQNNLLASTFHPELTGDLRMHQYFLHMLQDRSRISL